MKTEIGPTLREARIRHHIDLIEIEGRTKIRVRYLRALENEEWDVLPGPTYTRSFIRTYASFLGLDGERLAEDFRRLQEEQQLAEPASGREGRARPPRTTAPGAGLRVSSGMIAGLAVAGLVGVLVVLGLTSNSDNTPGPAAGPGGTKAARRHQHRAAAKRGRSVSIQLTATGEVWVCALAADGTPVVNGEILEAGGQKGPFHSPKFDLAFGNGGVGLQVNGQPFQVEDTPSPVGYEVTPDGVRPLPEGSRPDCT